MITLYSTKTCTWCRTVERFLRLQGVEFEKVYVDDDMATRQKLYEQTGLSAVPVTTNGTDFVVGWNAARIKALIS